MKYKLIIGTFYIPLIALAVVSQLYILMPVSTNLLLFVTHASADNIGLLTTFFGIFYAIGLIVWGSLSDKIGKDLTLIIGLLLLAGVSFLLPLLANYYLLLLARSAQGFCAASFPPVALAWISINLPDSSKSRAISIISCAFLLAATIGQWLGSLLISNSLLYAMWFLGGIYACGATIFYFYRLKSEKNNLTVPSTTLISILSKLPTILINRKLFPVYLCSLFVLLGFVALYSVLYRSSLISHIPTLRSIGIVAMLFSLTASYLFKVIKPAYLLTIALCLMALTLLIQAFFINDQINTLFVLYLSHFIFIIGLAYAIPSMIVYVATQSEIKDRGIATSLYTCILFIGVSLGAFLPSLINPFILITALSLLLLLCAIQLIINLTLIIRN